MHFLHTFFLGRFFLCPSFPPCPVVRFWLLPVSVLPVGRVGGGRVGGGRVGFMLYCCLLVQYLPMIGNYFKVCLRVDLLRNGV